MESLDFLRKLGLGRYGVTAGTYASGKDLPAEFLMDDVYGAKKDLISRKDVAHVGGARQKSRGRMVFFRITVALAVLVLLFLMAAGGISLWLFGSLGLWGGILSLTYQFAYNGRHSCGGIIALVLLGLLASFILVGVTATT